MIGDNNYCNLRKNQLFYNMRGMTQKFLDMQVGFLEKSTDVRLAQYETETRIPKADLNPPLADTLDLSPQVLAVPDIDSYIGLMHTLFAPEDTGLKSTRAIARYICVSAYSRAKMSHNFTK